MFSVLPWQQPVVTRALALKQEGRLPHAILLEAKSAGDLTPLLNHLAASLLCETPTGQGACGICRACADFSNTLHSDFKSVRIEYNEKTKKDNKNITIDQIRDLIHEVRLSHGQGDLKVAVIYPAEKMSLAAANSLLKTLEEPGAGVLLILAGHNKGKLPVTIRSRCQQWALIPPTDEESMAWLQANQLSDSDARNYLEFAKNDPVLALELRDSNYADILDQFRSGFTDMLNSRLSSSELAARLCKFDVPIIRRLLSSTTRAYVNRFLGISQSGGNTSAISHTEAQAILNLDQRMHRQLAVEENNLDLQLQLEDVLISLKQAILRSKQ